MTNLLRLQHAAAFLVLPGSTRGSRAVRRGVAGLALLIFCPLFGTPVRAGFEPSWKTRQNGANAVIYQGQIYTLDSVLAKREANPARFDQFHRRFAQAFAEGKESLIARRNRNPRRFDRYHPLLGWLIVDATPDPKPEIDPGTVFPPPAGGGGTIITPPPPGGGVTVQSVPEPGTLTLAGIGLALAGLAAAYRVRKNTRGV
jgi:hypothetical protein